MSWTWQYEDQSGIALDQPATSRQPTQSDAESWLGEHWRELLADGVAQVRLFEDDREVYGPMPLSED
jgi:hypothetical protein